MQHIDWSMELVIIGHWRRQFITSMAVLSLNYFQCVFIQTQPNVCHHVCSRDVLDARNVSSNTNESHPLNIRSCLIHSDDCTSMYVHENASKACDEFLQLWMGERWRYLQHKLKPTSWDIVFRTLHASNGISLHLEAARRLTYVSQWQPRS